MKYIFVLVITVLSILNTSCRKEGVEKVNQDGMMVLNDFSFFHNYINDGVRSQKAELRSYYVFLLLL